jgi:hypothetical protein
MFGLGSSRSTDNIIGTHLAEMGCNITANIMELEHYWPGSKNSMGFAFTVVYGLVH